MGFEEPGCGRMCCAWHPGHIPHNVRSPARVNGQCSEDFGLVGGVHQASVLSPLLFIPVLEALSCQLRTSVPWELLYVVDLLLIENTLEECVFKVRAWKAGMESVNMKKTQFMVSGVNLDVLKKSSMYPCVVSCKGVGNNSVEIYHLYAYIIGAVLVHSCLQWYIWNVVTHNKVNTLRWRHNGHDSVSNHQPHDCLLNRLFRRRSKKTSKLRVTGLCAGNSQGIG